MAHPTVTSEKSKNPQGGGGGSGGGGGGWGASSASLPLSALECAVCLSLVVQPVSLSCGHTFCRLCLVNTLRRNKKQCPTCRAVCHNSAEDQPEDVMIAHIARTCFPEMYARRLEEIEGDRDSLNAELPIFFYNVPMFPGETLQLHLFEPRYKLMMKRIVNTSRRFAYVPNYEGYVATNGDVALIAKLSECEFLSDGRVLLVAKLTSRHTVTDHFVEEGTQGLHYCRVEERRDDAPPAGSDLAARLEELHAKTRELARRVIEPVTAQVIDRYGEIPAGAEAFSLWTTSILPMQLHEKHALLSSNSTMERLRACEHHLISFDGGAPPPPSGRRNVAAVAQEFERQVAAGETEESLAARVARGPAGAAAARGGQGGGGGGGEGGAGSHGRGEEKAGDEDAGNEEADTDMGDNW
eukprot:g18443.t1